jgi:hypothetical protein
MSDIAESGTKPVKARLLSGRETIGLDGLALFDRVINLKFTRAHSESFIVRSDYEPVYRRNGSVFFKRCLQKPEISVSYEQVPGNTVMKCEINVANLFIDPSLDSLTQKESKINSQTHLEENGNPVREIVLQMGYINQFPDWSKEGMADTDEKLTQFFNLDNHVFNNNPRAGTAVELRLKVLDTTSKGAPPDKVTTFNCVVGSLYPCLTWEHADGDLLPAYGDIEFPSQDMSPVERALYALVTRRFPSPALSYSFSEAGGEKALLITAPYVKSDNTIVYPNASPKNPERLVLAPDGCMTRDQADLFGVKCLVSEKLREAIGDATDTYLSAYMTEAVVSYARAMPLVAQQRLLSGQLRQIQRAYPRMRWYVMNNGDFFCYDVSQDAKSLFEDPEILAKQEEEIVTLSAIYDITIDGMRRVRAPFHGFINPMTTIRVNARYNIGTLVGFYYPKQAHKWLVVITQKVEFSTTGEENTMELSCVDVDPDNYPEYDPDTGKITVKKSELENAAAKRTARFEFKILDWEVYKTDGTHSRLAFIAERMVQSANLEGVKELWEKDGKVPTVPLAIKVLLERNKSLLDTEARKKRGNAPEYEIYKEELNALGVFHVPYLYESFEGAQDVIKYGLPWIPDDDGTLKDIEEEESER